MAKPKPDTLYIRLTTEAKRAFEARAERNGRSVSDVARELITAWCEGRVTVHPHE